MTSGTVRAARDGQSESEGIWAGSAGCEGVMLRMATTNNFTQHIARVAFLCGLRALGSRSVAPGPAA